MSSNTISTSSMSKCAACGKGGDNLKVCTSCEQVYYCNAKCRKAHRSKHKKECKQYVAEKRNKNAAIRAEADAIDAKIGKIIDSISDNLGKISTISENCLQILHQKRIVLSASCLCHSQLECLQWIHLIKHAAVR